MNIHRPAVAALVAIVVSGCAKQPSAIAPATIPFEAYTGLECSRLAADLAAEEANLRTLSAAQSNAATGDAVGVFLVGVPISSVTGGDKEGDIAVSKGKIEAMKAARLKKSC